MNAPDDSALRRRLRGLGIDVPFQANIRHARRKLMEEKLQKLETAAANYSLREFATEADAAAERVKIAALADEVEKLKRELGDK